MSWRPLPTEGHGSCNMQNKAIQGMLRNQFKPKNNYMYIFLYEKKWNFLSIFFKKKKTPINIIYVQRGPIQSGLSMYAVSVKNFYLLSCKDINTRSAYTSIDD